MRRILWRSTVAVLPLALFMTYAAAFAQGPANMSPESIGIRLEQATVEAVVSESEAIFAAKIRLGESRADGASQVTARHVLYTDEQYYTEQDVGKKILQYDRIPAWVVTFHGVNFPVGRGSKYGPRINSEVTVVINSSTGEAIGLYTYR